MVAVTSYRRTPVDFPYANNCYMKTQQKNKRLSFYSKSSLVRAYDYASFKLLKVQQEDRIGV